VTPTQQGATGHIGFAAEGRPFHLMMGELLHRVYSPVRIETWSHNTSYYYLLG
jgi:hypothetical protein